MIKLECELKKNEKIIEQKVLGGIKLSAIAEVRDEQNNLIEKKKIKCNSYVRQFLEGLMCHTGCQVVVNVRDVGNVLRSIMPYVSTFGSTGGAGTATLGIIVGTGTTTPVISDYVMQTPIAHGTGTGQLQYAAQDFEAPSSPDANSSYMGLRRSFTNGSGATVTIREIGIYCIIADTGTINRTFLLTRDLISGGLAVPAGATATITYRVVVFMPGLTRQFVNIISRQIRNASISAVNINNGVATEGVSENNFRIANAGGQGYADSVLTAATYTADNMGVTIGTGTTAEDTSDWRLATKIAHGKGSGQILHYGSYCEHSLTVVGNTGSFKMERTFENLSGAGITVNEVGLQCRAGSHLYLMARHLVSPGVTVANGEILKATYTLSITT